MKREMHLPNAMVPDSLESAVQLHSSRAKGALLVPLEFSFLLTAYVAWPEQESKRNSWVAALTAQATIAHQNKTDTSSSVFELFGGTASLLQPALAALEADYLACEQKMTPVADIFLRLVDMHYEPKIKLRGGTSVAKAIGLCELDADGKSHAVLYRCWRDFKNVSHLIAAAAVIANKCQVRLFSAIWFAPDAVCAIAAGYQQFALSVTAHSRPDPLLSGHTIWRVPSHCHPAPPFLTYRRLSDDQIEFLNRRRAKNAKSTDS
jgi:hypothetical protein